jgi:N-acyl amino acid synthase of PEP-CTERM/exosortase system
LTGGEAGGTFRRAPAGPADNAMIQLGEYTFQIADTDALREAAHRLRYQVYVEEYGFEKAADHPGGLEKDDFDPHAIPLVALDRKGRVVGTARLIQRSPRGFPALGFADADKRAAYAPPARVAEVSRLAMDKEFRGAALEFQREMDYFFRHLTRVRKKASSPLAFDKNDAVPRRLVVVLGLISVIYETAREDDVDHLIMASEKSLWLLLKRFGLPWVPIGPETDYHGRRAPYALVMDAAAGPIGQFRKKLMTALIKQPTAPPPAVQERELVTGLDFRLGGFHFTAATTSDLLESVYRLRYKAYVQDIKVADPTLFPRQRHIDPQDSWAIHALALDNKRNAVGTIRLVLNSQIGFQTLEAADPDQRTKIAASRKIAELSRLALADPYARASADIWSALMSIPIPPFALSGEDHPLAPGDRRRGAILLLGLFRLLYRISKRLRLSAWCFMGHPDAAAVYAKRGVSLHQIGPLIQESVGARAAHMVNFHEIEKHLLNFGQIKSVSQELMTQRLARSEKSH